MSFSRLRWFHERRRRSPGWSSSQSSRYGSGMFPLRCRSARRYRVYGEYCRSAIAATVGRALRCSFLSKIGRRRYRFKVRTRLRLRFRCWLVRLNSGGQTAARMNLPVTRVPGEIPLIRGHWFHGVARERREKPLELFTWASSLADAVRFRVLIFSGVLVSNPEMVKHVLVDNASNYWKGRALIMMKAVVGNGLLTSEGDFWKRQRRLAQPAFHRERLAAMVEQFVEATRKTLDGWEGRATLDVLPEMMALTMSIVA